jgi:TonB family protein
VRSVLRLIAAAGSRRALARHARVVAALLAATGGLATRAAAADPPVVAPPPIVPPRALVLAPPAYPPGETTDATVILEVVVELDGTTSGERIIDGREPFAAEALATVRRYRFEPATRAGTRVRARIRIAVDFSAPAPVPAGGSDPAASAAPAAPPAAGVRGQPAIIEDDVDVLGLRRPVSSPTEHRIGRADIRLIPGAFGDPYRAIDILPGVVPIVSGLPYFFIRGAPPSAVGYFVDEVRVPYLFHFGLGPGVVQPALIEEVSLHPAAFPARYGRYAGGIVAGTLREPPKELRGEAQIRLYDAGAYVEAPFANGRATAGVGGRYSYTAALLSLFAPDVSVDYRDYNARVSYALDDKTRLSAFALGAFDFTSQKEEGVERVIFASEFHRLDLRLDRRTATTETRVALMLGLDRTRLESARFAQNRLVGLRGRHRVSLRTDLDVEIGADALAELYGGDLPSPYAVNKSAYEEAFKFFSPRTDTSSGAWATASFHPAKGWDLTGTLRGDVFTSAGSIAFGPSPRASMRVPLVAKVAFLAALGVAPQAPAFAIPVPAVGYRGLPGGLAFAYQKSAGLEVELPARFNVRAVGFHHSYWNLRDFTRDRSNIDITDIAPPTGSPAQGYGLELFLNRKLTERFGAFVSYTLSRTELGSTTFDKQRVAPFDRTHVLQLGGSVDLGARWRASARLLTYSGWPTQEGIAGDASVSQAQAAASSSRLPTFTRLDLRIEKRWAFRKAGYISFVIEALNATGTRDVVGRSCGGPRGCRDRYFGPVIVPSIGVEGAL